MAKLGGTFDATGVEPNAPLERCRPATTRCRSCSPRCGSPRPAPARCSGSTWRCWRGRPGPARLRPAQPGQPEPDRGGDRAAHAQRDLPRGRQAPGRRQRGAALPADAGPGRRQAQRLQRGQGLQGGPAGSASAAPAAAAARPAGRAGRAPGAGRQRDGALEAERLIREEAAPSPIEFGDLTATALSPRPFGERPWRTGTLGPPAPGGNPELPSTRAACRAAIDQLRGEIDAIKAQIATADLERQASTARWTRAGTTGRAPRSATSARDRGAHRAHADAAGGPGRRAGFKDYLIEVLRDEFDDDAWQGFLDRAQALHDQREGA